MILLCKMFITNENLICCSFTLTVLKKISSSKSLFMYRRQCAIFKKNCDKYDVFKF